MIDELGRLTDLAERQEEIIRSGFFLEDWSRETTPAIDDSKWVVSSDGTGTAIRTVATAYIYEALSGLTNADTIRLRSIRRWRAGPDSWAFTSINRKLIVEFEAQFGTVASIENATFFAGLSAVTTATRASDNLIGWILTADALNAITDDGVGETVSAVGAPVVTNWHKLRMEIYASFITGAWSGHVDFYVDEVLQATHTTTAGEDLPDQTMYLNFYVPQEAAANSGALNLGPVRIFYSQPPAPLADPSADEIGYLKAAVTRGMGVLQGVCDPEMVASTTAVTSDDLAGFGDDYFNAHFCMMVTKNASAAATAPEFEVRLITDYVSASGAFTTAAFSANVEANDVVSVMHVNIAAKIAASGIADAGSDTNTLLDAVRTEGADYWIGSTVLMLSDNNLGLTRAVVDSAAGSLEVRAAFPNAIAAGDVYAILTEYHEIVPAGDSTENYQPRDVIGNKTDTASDDADSAENSLVRYNKSLMRTWKCVIPNIDISLAAIDSAMATDPSAGVPDVENTIMDLAITTGTMYRLEDLVLKIGGYGTGTQITVQLWELLNGNLRANYVVTRTCIIPTDYPITTYLSMQELFGKTVIGGDGIAVTAITDAGVTGALTCTYTYSTARVS